VEVDHFFGDEVLGNGEFGKYFYLLKLVKVDAFAVIHLILVPVDEKK
jgi:hypothetical protein